MKYTIFKTGFGWVGLAGSPRGLLCLILSDAKREAKVLIKERFQGTELIFDHLFFEEIASQIVAYFEGERITFNVPLDLGKSTPFQRRVWAVTKKIGYGQTQSYLWVARKTKSSPRAIGQALRKNPLPIIIPCHRVIQKNGEPGGYSSGLEWKKRLLSLEKLNV